MAIILQFVSQISLCDKIVHCATPFHDFCCVFKTVLTKSKYNISTLQYIRVENMNPLTNVKNVLKLSEAQLKGNNKSSWHDQYRGSAWIFIGGLPYDLTEGDVICVFSQYGEPVNINLVRDKATGKSKGFCFLCFQDQRSTDLSVDNLNGIKLLGRTLRVDHVNEYKAPKEKKDDDEITKILKKDGLAGVADKYTVVKENCKLANEEAKKQREKRSSSHDPEDSHEPRSRRKKKMRTEDTHKNHKRRKEESSSSSSSESDSSESAPEVKKKQKTKDQHRESIYDKKGNRKHSKTVEELKREAKLIQEELKRRQKVKEESESKRRNDNDSRHSPQRGSSGRRRSSEPKPASRLDRWKNVERNDDRSGRQFHGYRSETSGRNRATHRNHRVTEDKGRSRD